MLSKLHPLVPRYPQVLLGLRLYRVQTEWPYSKAGPYQAWGPQGVPMFMGHH